MKLYGVYRVYEESDANGYPILNETLIKIFKVPGLAVTYAKKWSNWHIYGHTSTGYDLYDGDLVVRELPEICDRSELEENPWDSLPVFTSRET